MFVISRFHQIKVLFYISYYDWGKENRPLQRGLCYMELRYIEVLLYPLSFINDIINNFLMTVVDDSERE